MHNLYQIFVHVAYGRGSVLLRRGDEIPRGWGNLDVSSPLTMHCTTEHFGTHTKTTEAIEMPFGMMTRVGPR